jgi:anti-anti-sigma factor
MVDTTAQPTTCTVPLVQVSVTDDVDHATVPGLTKAFHEILALRPEHVVVDLTACHVLDAAGIEMLLDVHRTLWRHNARLTLQSTSPRLRRLLTIARAAQVLNIGPDKDDRTR